MGGELFLKKQKFDIPIWKKINLTIEEAAENTGLTIASIKSRASKPGSGSKSKDGITFKWADEHTRRSKNAKKSKAKGK